jgi:hypothetical protein
MTPMGEPVRAMRPGDCRPTVARTVFDDPGQGIFMTTHLQGRSGTLRLLIGAFTLALLGAFLTATPAHARADNWSGIWRTEHQFGNPKLFLHYNEDDGVVKGTYKEDGQLKGRISGDLTKKRTGDVWQGKFRDEDGASVGKFRVVLNSDQVSFDGWFKTCGSFVCSEKYPWHGEHA